jgi:hypothetical protein
MTISAPKTALKKAATMSRLANVSAVTPAASRVSGGTSPARVRMAATASRPNQVGEHGDTPEAHHIPRTRASTDRTSDRHEKVLGEEFRSACWPSISNKL